jgi:hypothetical protein
MGIKERESCSWFPGESVGGCLNRPAKVSLPLGRRMQVAYFRALEHSRVEREKLLFVYPLLFNLFPSLKSLVARILFSRFIKLIVDPIAAELLFVLCRLSCVRNY